MAENQELIENDLDAQARYATIIEVLLRYPDVTTGLGGKAFGSSALKVNGKIFALIDSKGRFVVKLSRQRVDTLIASGDGERFDPGHGRLMKEWISVEQTSSMDWLTLAKEAMAFVGAQQS